MLELFHVANEQWLRGCGTCTHFWGDQKISEDSSEQHLRSTTNSQPVVWHWSWPQPFPWLLLATVIRSHATSGDEVSIPWPFVIAVAMLHPAMKWDDHIKKIKDLHDLRSVNVKLGSQSFKFVIPLIFKQPPFYGPKYVLLYFLFPTSTMVLGDCLIWIGDVTISHQKFPIIYA